jgi:hypothetical protein
VGTSAPPAGRLPIGKPSAVPRSQAGQDRRRSSRVITARPRIGSTVALPVPASRWPNVSPSANNATTRITTSMPSSMAGTPNDSRGWPVCASMPTRPTVSPMARAAKPLTRFGPSSAATVTNATAISATYSGGPKLRAKSATTGAMKVRPRVPIVPATKLPMAAVASAAAARPARAILLPSSADIIDAVSPGVLSRMEVVEPPYMPP